MIPAGIEPDISRLKAYYAIQLHHGTFWENTADGNRTRKFLLEGQVTVPNSSTAAYLFGANNSRSRSWTDITFLMKKVHYHYATLLSTECNRIERST